MLSGIPQPMESFSSLMTNAQMIIAIMTETQLLASKFLTKQFFYHETRKCDSFETLSSQTIRSERKNTLWLDKMYPFIQTIRNGLKWLRYARRRSQSKYTARGYGMIFRKDYFTTFAPVAKITDYLQYLSGTSGHSELVHRMHGHQDCLSQRLD